MTSDATGNATQGSPSSGSLVINGWSLYAHPLFLYQLEGLIEEVEVRKARDPLNYRKKNCTKRLAAIFRLVTNDIPANPAAAHYRQGNTLGAGRRHWFRAKFFQRYRLFFRFDSARQIIVFAWVNDDDSLRAYGSRTDAYTTFKSMLDSGNPPEDFNSLLKAAKASSERFEATVKAVTEGQAEPSA